MRLQSLNNDPGTGLCCPFTVYHRMSFSSLRERKRLINCLILFFPLPEDCLTVIDRNKEQQTDFAVSYIYRELMQTGVERVEPANLTLGDNGGET